MDGNIDIYLGLGSNLGDREKNICSAVDELDRMFSVEHSSVSSLFETEPWGFSCSDKFMNAVVKYRIDVSGYCDMKEFCYTVLEGCKNIERSMGRRGEPEYDSCGNRIYRSRIIDIDILMVGDFRMDEPDLKIPHPLMKERDFVMLPLREICGDSI